MRTMMRIALLSAGVGCQHEPDPPKETVDGGQSGTAVPPMCVEDSRVVVLDPTVPADGFSMTASEVIARVEGIWRGEGEIEGSPATVDTTVAWDGGQIEAILAHYDEGVPGEEMGAPTAVFDCPPTYEIGFLLAVDALPFLAVEGTSRISVAEGLGLSIPIEVDESAVEGDLQPPVWENPQYWDRTSLSALFQQYESEGALSSSLDLQWWAINDDPVQSMNQVTTANGGQISTGTIEPEGMTSPILHLENLVLLP